MLQNLETALSFSDFDFHFLQLCVYVGSWGSLWLLLNKCSTDGCQRRASDLLEVVFQVAVSHKMLGLGTELDPLQVHAVLLAAHPALQNPTHFKLIFNYIETFGNTFLCL